MFRQISLPIFCLLFAGTSCANAGVMLGLSEHDADRGAVMDVASMSVAVADLFDEQNSDRRMNQCPDSPTDLAGTVSSSTSSAGGSAITSAIDGIVAIPQVECRLWIHDSVYPPSPDLSGLIKPPQASC